MEPISMQVIAHIKNDLPDKFGIPRQSGLVDALHSRIIFEPKFRNADSLRGLEAFSHLWIIWQFSKSVREDWSPTVRPPRLGGNTRMGVFATRSPFRPNGIGLSSVRILGIEHTDNFGAVINVAGADLMDGTPILDIKPYIPYCDSHPDATGGFTDTAGDFLLKVNFPEPLLQRIPLDKQAALTGILSHDPRPSYQQDSDRLYGLNYSNFNIQFRVVDQEMTVVSVQEV